MRRFGPTLLLALAVAGCGASAHHDRTIVHHGDGVTYRVPAGWHVAARSLTPHLTNPRELFTAGTGRLADGPGRCAHVPSAALAAMRPNDVLVSVQERFGSPRAFPARPSRFALPASSANDAAECAGPRRSFAASWFGFRDRGRGFHVIVAVGHSAPQARVRQALEILDSIRLVARRPVRMDPDDAIPEHDAAAGIDFVHPAAWRRYRQSLTEAIAPRDQLALGTFPVHQRVPDRGCAPKTALRARPPTGGFVFMYELDVNPTELARFPPRPARLTLPRSSLRPYECFGSSWRVDFRDGGRAFTAHVYGPLRRRREALAILDSLRIRPAPFSSRLHAARFAPAAGWRTRVSGPQHEGGCLRHQRTSWASTVPFRDGASNLPPHRMIEALPPDGIIIAAVQWVECRRVEGLRVLRPPLRFDHAVRMQFPGPRGDKLPLLRVRGRFPGRYNVDLWVFYGRRHPTRAQRVAAQRELSAVRWPADL
jgi:hypothetical protein